MLWLLEGCPFTGTFEELVSPGTATKPENRRTADSLSVCLDSRQTLRHSVSGEIRALLCPNDSRKAIWLSACWT